MGMTLLDVLDTIWIMGMKDEFKDGTEWVKANLRWNLNRQVSVFETNIRALGGLLAAYDLSGDAVFLEKAKDLGERLLKVRAVSLCVSVCLCASVCVCVRLCVHLAC
jgi:mannosyl-oligosaccharide alpha-1,2-mannosidase